jgi:hypothetical protein
MSFIYPTYTFSSHLPLDTLEGLVLPTSTRSGLGHANPRVLRLVGFYTYYVCSFFNYLTLVMSIRCCAVAKTRVPDSLVRRLHLSLPAEDCRGVNTFAS